MSAMSPKFLTRNDRFLISAETLWMKEIVSLLKEREKDIFEGSSRKIKTPRQIGAMTLRVASIFQKETRQLIPFLNKDIRIDGMRAAREFDLTYIDARESIFETAKAVEQWRQFENERLE